jgi:FdhD protein
MVLPTFAATVIGVSGPDAVSKSDTVAVEEPLEIRLGYGPATNRQRTVVAVTMRTPGHDAELAIGFLFSEGLLADPADLLSVQTVAANSVRVDLKPDVAVNLDRLNRRGAIHSGCGVCGKTTLDAIEADVLVPLPPGPAISSETIHGLAAKLRGAQASFDATGGLHAVGLFDARGTLLTVREDVGRHNALDKVIGAVFQAGRLPLADRVLFTSSRASFELVQKAAMAGVPVFAAVGAPTSLAVQLAERFGMSLLGFVRAGRFNVYAGRERIAVPS